MNFDDFLSFLDDDVTDWSIDAPSGTRSVHEWLALYVERVRERYGDREPEVPEDFEQLGMTIVGNYTDDNEV